MHLRHNSERRAPQVYQGDGTYSNNSSLLHNRSSSPPLPPADADDEATIILSDSGTRRCNFVFAAKGELQQSPLPALLSTLRIAPALLPELVSTKGNPPRRIRSMANVKFVRRPRDKASPAREETPRRKRSRVERAVTADSIVSATSIQQPVPFVMSTDFDTSSVIPSGKSVAFPSLELCEPNRSPRVGRHGIERLIKERQGGDTKKRNESFRRIDRMYEARDLPRQMSTREREWYASLKVRMAARGDEPEVGMLSDLSIYFLY